MFVESGMCRGIRSGYGVFRFPEMVLLFLCLFFCEAFFASEALGFSSEDRRGRTASGVTVASSFADEEGDKGDALFELVLLKDKAEEGDPDAQFDLGRRYLQGVGLERNDVMALHWVRAAAQQGYARAEAGLAWMYAVGRGVVRDDVQAFDWYKRAAENGYMVAQRMLGKCYEKGVGTAVDADRARFWYEKAAEQGDEYAVARLKALSQPVQSGYGAYPVHAGSGR